MQLPRQQAEFFCPDNKTVDQGHESSAVDVDCVLDKSTDFDQENLDATSALAALCETQNEQHFCGDL
ncbi:unnamed protein product [Brachionus calyciflorus]|uniref:Uncharacterized protein n=1 Tax=Brachionus calyciflorus TaxID=104777 RepID=A0A814RPJ5_9BILA|nr:unnamed protein product [Brachionus calyciflorus]